VVLVHPRTRSEQAVGGLQADVHAVLHGLVLGDGLEGQPGPGGRLDDDLVVAGARLRVAGWPTTSLQNRAGAYGSGQSNETLRRNDTPTAPHRCPRAGVTGL